MSVKRPFPIPAVAYQRALRDLVRRALAEDIGAGDCTTAALALGKQSGGACVITRKPGMLAGADAFAATFRTLDPHVRLTWHVREGRRFRRGTKIVTIRGRATALLTAERTALNFLARLSGVATATAELIRLIPQHSARLLDTRKTTPGLRLFEKRATALGGAVNHRLGLYDALMIKDNHIVAVGGLRTAIRRGQARRGTRRLICEVCTQREIAIALAEEVDWLLLDNFTVPRLRAAVRAIRQWERDHRRRIVTEASGGISARTIAAVARTGIDFISVGAITHSAPAIDFSMEWLPR